MFGPQHYVPILKGKAGEFKALCTLAARFRTTMTPFIDVVRVETDFQTKEPTTTIENHLQRVAKGLTRSWIADHPVFVDLSDISPETRTAQGEHYVSYLLDRLRALRTYAIPTTGLDRDADYNRAVQTVVDNDSRGVCVRLLREDIDIAHQLGPKLKALLQSLVVDPQDSDIIMDFGKIADTEVGPLQRVAERAIRHLDDLGCWRTVTLAGSAFPDKLSFIGTNSSVSVSRAEFALWERVIRQGKVLPRLPSFGDYAIAHPDHLDLDWRKIRMVPTIKYALPHVYRAVRNADSERENP